jgi:hypothetical protein
VVIGARQTAVLVALSLAWAACELVAGIDDRKVANPASGGAGGGGQGGDGGARTGGNAGSGGVSGLGGGTAGFSGSGGVGNSGGATSPGGADGGTPLTGGVPTDGGLGSGGRLFTGGAGGGGTTGAGGTKYDGGTPDVAVADVAPTCPPVGVTGTGTGLVGEYYVTNSFTGLQVTRLDPTIDFNWGGSPDVGVPFDAFTVRWTGQIQPRFTGIYTFFTNNDDGARLWIDGRMIINDWTEHAATENSGTISLVAGQKYDIRMDFWDQTGVAVAQLSWMSECQPREIVPASQLYIPPQTCTAPITGNGTGVKGDYYDNQDLSGFKLTRTDPTVSFVWPDTTSPDPLIASGSYSVRWTGQVLARYTGPLTFYVVADDGVRLFIDDVKLIDDWASHATTENAATIQAVAGQKYNLRLEYYEESGGGQVQLLWGSLCQAREIVPQAQLFPTYAGLVCADPAGAGTGLKGDYYDNNDFTNLVVSHPAEVINFNWADGSPATGVAADYFSVRWTGQLEVPQTGVMSFYTVSDDGARLWIGGQLVIDDWVAHEAHEASGTATLTAGQRYDVQLDFREDAEKASIQLLWSSACQAKGVIPASQLYPPVVIQPDAGPDARDARPDTPPDVRPDTPPDTGPDAAPDAAPDAPPDGEPDAPPDAPLVEDGGVDGA